ncbi:HyaD/HybD family hydrogenase maturation endopeptidase [Candidatus Endoriftia persephone]|jgi:hydrogenase maturation protease|uniref:Hydrogenase expression/formation protein HoxM n=3 Tax=Gammaproteobacteria TaxID=1236 RepID=G2FIG3_9GAMM|nr:HyaD/HybD family hydrogenase maturation endopeptidase [Candidatus Endoriftia persephone]EGV51835.1 hydrogenase expression/formation protein hoxM [endosymbiont of Riftia pachyptila (vent Ph05)]EGW53434.1 hydrogenase expression/formation protein HoxM [endosymbiont of Tevnia jerichonana (vent Tica)]USF89050.1 HyaD/HybD family hydrogenase maturation endopeptidase [Candidatus Endoriftia persephone]
MSIENVLILGIGNLLFSDEGVGVQLVERLRRQLGEQVGLECLDGGTLSFTLAEPIARADGLVVVDAARMQAEPGEIGVFCGLEMDRYLSGNRQSVHEVSLGDLLDISRLSEQLPEQCCLVGIEPASMEWGERLSPPVEAAVEPAIERILTILSRWEFPVTGKGIRHTRGAD